MTRQLCLIGRNPAHPALSPICSWPVPEVYDGEANARSYFGSMALLACLVR
jgi:hypothetical protein